MGYVVSRCETSPMSGSGHKEIDGPWKQPVDLFKTAWSREATGWGWG